MKIAYIVPSLAAKGPVIVARDLSDIMTLHGHHCCVFYFDDIVEISCNCPTIKIKAPIDFSEFDVVHSHGLRPDRYVEKHREYSGKVKYISTVHNYVFQDFKYQYNWFVAQIFGRLWIKILQKFDNIVTLSEDAEKYYKRWFSNHKLTYAYNSRIVDKSQQLTQKEKESIVTFKGNFTLIGINALLTKRKGVDMIIKALVHLPNYRLFIAGDGKSRNDLEKLAIKLGVRDRCYFAGFIKNAYRFLAYYDIYAAPSRSEGFPLMLLEAAQYKVPTVCSRLSVFEEIFTPDEVSFFELDNIQSLVEAIKNVPNGEKMYKRYENCYTPQKMYERYLEIYNGR